MGSQLGSSGTFSANDWTTVDVTASITGNGTYSSAISTTSSTNITLRLRGAKGATLLRARRSQWPKLVIVTGDGATNTPTLTAKTHKISVLSVIFMLKNVFIHPCEHLREAISLQGKILEV